MKVNIFKIRNKKVLELIEFFQEKQNTKAIKDKIRKENNPEYYYTILKNSDSFRELVEINEDDLEVKSISTYSYSNQAIEDTETEWNSLFELIDYGDDDEVKIANKKGTVSTLFIFCIEDIKNNKIWVFAIPFGQAYHAIKSEYIDLDYSFSFLNKNEINNLRISSIVYPFSNADKVISSHKNTDVILTSSGGFAEKITCNIKNDFGLNTFLTKSPVDITHNSITLFINSNSKKRKNEDNKNIKQLLEETLKKIVVTEVNGKTKNSYSTLKEVGAEKADELEKTAIKRINDDEIEFVWSKENIITDLDGFETTTEMESDKEIYYEDEGREEFKFDDDLMKNIIEFSNRKNIELSSIIENLYFDNDNNKKIRFNFWKYITIFLEDEDSLYMKYNSRWKISSKNALVQLKEDLSNIKTPLIQNKTFFNELNSFYEKMEKDGTWCKFDYLEIKYNRINSKKQDCFFADTLNVHPTNIEAADLIYLKESNGSGLAKEITMCSVKTGIRNEGMCKNIDQSLTSLKHWQTKDGAYLSKVREIIGDNSITFKMFKTFEIRFVLEVTPAEAEEWLKKGENLVLGLNGRTIFKYKLIEWQNKVMTAGLEPKITFELLILTEEEQKLIGLINATASGPSKEKQTNKKD